MRRIGKESKDKKVRKKFQVTLPRNFLFYIKLESYAELRKLCVCVVCCVLCVVCVCVCVCVWCARTRARVCVYSECMNINQSYLIVYTLCM
jgi:hypothetical protein